VTSKRDHRYQRLDGEAGISCRWQQVSAKSQLSHMIDLAAARTNHRSCVHNSRCAISRTFVNLHRTYIYDLCTTRRKTANLICAAQRRQT